MKSKTAALSAITVIVVIILLLITPVLALIVGVKYKMWSLEKNFEAASIPVYQGSQKMFTGPAGNDLNPFPDTYTYKYKLEPSIPMTTVKNFYVEKLTQAGWKLDEVLVNSPLFSKGSAVTKVYLSCAINPTVSSGTPKSGICADVGPSYYLEVTVHYSPDLPDYKRGYKYNKQ